MAKARIRDRHETLYSIVHLGLLFIRKSSLLLIVLLCILSISFSIDKRSFILSKFRELILNSSKSISLVISKKIDLINDYVDNIYDIIHTYNENNALRQENLILKQNYMLVQQIVAENNELRKLMHFVAEPEYNLISARIFADISGPYLKKAIIAAGSKNGIKKGQVVVNASGLVGRIIDVTDKTASILLISDVNSRVPVITSESRERAIIAGNNSNNLSILYLPEDSKVRDGEFVVTSGDSQFFPSGLPVGKIKIIQDKTIQVLPVVDWNRLEYISVINY